MTNEPEIQTGTPEPTPNQEPNQPKPKGPKAADQKAVVTPAAPKAPEATETAKHVEEPAKPHDPRKCPHCGFEQTGLAGGLRHCGKCNYSWPK